MKNQISLCISTIWLVIAHNTVECFGQYDQVFGCTCIKKADFSHVTDRISYPFSLVYLNISTYAICVDPDEMAHIVFYFRPIKTNTCADSVDPDETAHNEQSHLDLHCLPFCSRFVTAIPVFNNQCIQIQRQKSPLWKPRDVRVKSFYLCHM